MTRTDGSRVRFHPNLINKEVSITDGDQEFERHGPKAGRGKSDGPGAYRKMLSLSYDEEGAAGASGSAVADVAAAGDGSAVADVAMQVAAVDGDVGVLPPPVD